MGLGQVARAAPGLRTLQRGSIQLHYPQASQALAVRLADQLPPMVAFLHRQGVQVPQSLHILLDDALDRPAVVVHVIPHLEIRIPLRAPGVLEDGYLASDPWRYFLFKGLCLESFYCQRSGVPKALSRVFGQIIAPNVVLPQWFTDGVSHLLYRQYHPDHPDDPMARAIRTHAAFPSLDRVSHHPEKWPGQQAYRIYGRPFIQWVDDHYGLDSLLNFLHIHGEGVVPIEIEYKAEEIFGVSWARLWKRYRDSHAKSSALAGIDGTYMTGYLADPLVSWSGAGLSTGIKRRAERGRYGFRDNRGRLWLSEYSDEGVAHLVVYGNEAVWPTRIERVWDPGAGGVAVTRRGAKPYLIHLPRLEAGGLELLMAPQPEAAGLIPPPPGAIQMSGPVADASGRIAVAANVDGNWDIWLYNGAWLRVSDSPAVEMDPWFRDGRLIFASNRSGHFQIESAAGEVLTRCGTAAVLPRDGYYLCLERRGWRPKLLRAGQALPPEHAPSSIPQSSTGTSGPVQPVDSRKYAPLSSLWPNYLRPELFYDSRNLELGVATASRDVSGFYETDMGLRYSLQSDDWSWRLGAKANGFGVRYAHYDQSYTPFNNGEVDESRNETKLYYAPDFFDSLVLSGNWREFGPRDEPGDRENEYWGALEYERAVGHHLGWLTAEWYEQQTRSLFGGAQTLVGKSVTTRFHLQGGKTWGIVETGHTGFRIGGNVSEGYFTQRPSRLFPLRGFSSNVLESGQALTGGWETYWPLFNLQRGYETLPLFLHRFYLGTFLDAGAAGDPMTGDQLLVGAGLELVTSLEIAWGNFSALRIGVAWPLEQPDGLDQQGPVWLILLGRPI